MSENQCRYGGGSGGPEESLQENSTWTKIRRMHMAVPIIKEACPLSISTRGIGFMLSMIAPSLKDYCIKDDGEYKVNFPIAAMYRASLAQLEEKMYYARQNQSWPSSFRSVSDPSMFDPPAKFSFSLHRLLNTYNRNVSPLALIINSIGSVEVNNKHFEPRFLAERSPLNIRITNLREYCVEMSNLETESSKRVAGYKLNSIPNAKWEFDNSDDPQSVYLTNPDEIISADYNDNSMLHDLYDLNMCVNQASCMKRELYGEIEYKRPGDPGILMSTHVVPGESMRMNNNQIDSRKIDFWSRESFEPLSWSIGAMALVGEILDPTIVSQRSRNLAAHTIYVDWRSTVMSLMY